MHASLILNGRILMKILLYCNIGNINKYCNCSPTYINFMYGISHCCICLFSPSFTVTIFDSHSHWNLFFFFFINTARSCNIRDIICHSNSNCHTKFKLKNEKYNWKQKFKLKSTRGNNPQYFHFHTKQHYQYGKVNFPFTKASIFSMAIDMHWTNVQLVKKKKKNEKSTIQAPGSFVSANLREIIGLADDSLILMVPFWHCSQIREVPGKRNEKNSILCCLLSHFCCISSAPPPSPNKKKSKTVMQICIEA